MTHALLEQHKKWRDNLIYHLRMNDVPGDRIGDILLEVESHIQESGETPQDAFGDSRSYAETRAATSVPIADEDDGDMSLWFIMISSFLGTFLFVSGALGLGKAFEAVLFLPSWLALLIGGGLVTYTLVTLPIDLVRHPVTNQSLLGESPRIKWFFGLGLMVVGFVFFGIGRMLA